MQKIYEYEEDWLYRENKIEREQNYHLLKNQNKN